MAKAIINTARNQGKISKYIYGQFAEHLGRCIYEGLYVDENSDIPNKNGMRCDVVNALKELEIPVLRWPGGCFADDYHWRDGIGEKSQRPYMVNTNWGGVVENNHFGTHEFFELCEQLGTEPYICGNVGSGTVQEMRDWVEYMTFDGDSPLANERRKNGREKPWKLKFFGVGNENWGCGGNMRPEYYADLYKRYATFIRNYGDEPIYKIAGGPNVDDTRWMETLMQNIRHMTEGISLHNYTFESAWENKGSATEFDNDGWYKLMANAMKMDKVINVHTAIMDRYDPEKKIDLIVDEWGNWFDVEIGTNPGFLYQQNTMRDVISGMLILDVDYDCEEQEINGLKFPKISISASKKNGEMTVSICNTSLDSDEDMELDLRDGEFSVAGGEILVSEHMNDCNTFDAPNTVEPKKFDVSLENDKLSFKLPKMSACVITLK